ncbi:MAG: hypothetical protein ACJ76X_07395 [Solirubrobacteraceae bacterium]
MSQTECAPTAPGAGRTADTLDRALRVASAPTHTGRLLLERRRDGRDRSRGGERGHRSRRCTSRLPSRPESWDDLMSRTGDQIAVVGS